MIRMTSELETNLVAVERIEEYCETPTEVNFIKVQTATNNLVPRISPLYVPGRASPET